VSPTVPSSDESGRYADLIRDLDAIVWEADARTWRFQFVSAQAERILGYPLSRWYDQADFWQEHIHPDDRSWVIPLCVESTGRLEAHSFDYRMLAADGRVVWLRDSVTVTSQDGRPVTLKGVMVDITASKEVERAFFDSRERLQLAIETSNLGYWDWNLVTNECEFSPEWKRQIGYEESEIDGRYDEWSSRVHADDRSTVMAVIGDYLDQRRPDYVVEFRLRHRDGSYRSISSHGVAMRNATGLPIRMIGCHFDITERRRSEALQRQSEERLRAVIANAPAVAIQWFDLQGRVLLWNEASENLFGFSAAEAIGRTLDQLIHTPEEARRFVEMLAAIEATGKSVGPQEYSFRTRSGNVGVCLSTIFKIPGDDQGHWFVCMDVDLTARKRAEEESRYLEAQVLHAQKLESLGVLAGGIAHDFNNLLTAIVGNAGLALLRLPPDSPVGPMLREIEHAAKRATDLTQQMLAYSGRGRFFIQPLRLDVVVEEMTTLLASVVSKKATVDLQLEPAAISADATQIRQIVMNLITNASDALEDRSGRIQIRTGVLSMSAADLTSRFMPVGLAGGEYACLELQDTGCGMTEETLSRMFDPFFTTKFAGRGLGLAAVLGIVRSHHGTVQVSSGVGSGTLFRILFPAQPIGAIEIKEPGAAPSPQHSTGTILLVDDEPSVRLLAQRTLELAGFQVLAAEDGREGLRVFLDHADEIVAAVVDLTMPNMDGLELLRHLRDAAPDLPVLLSSGYSEHEVSGRLGGHMASGFIQKPFHPRALVGHVHAALAGRR
jgi:two-component system cell cycle sensor histidine kinase/response regulator CckA